MDLYHTDSEGPDRYALQRGLAKLISVAQQQGNVGYIAVHGKVNVLNSFDGVLAPQVTKKFVKEGNAHPDSVVI